MIIKKVLKNKTNGVKLIIIPKKEEDIVPGDYVQIIKVKDQEDKNE